MNPWRITLTCLSLILSTPLLLSAAIPAGEALLTGSGIKGGVIVHLGCGNGKTTAALHANDRYLVHGLDTNAANVEKAKAHIDSCGLYGKVSVETYDGKNLPYGDNIVNLIVVSDKECQVPRAELERVLAPRGVLMSDTKWTKPVPPELDEWTHFLYDASGNAVCNDKHVRRPRHLQWYAGPKRSRHHDALASMSAMTSSNGRLFYIYDEGSTSLMHRPPKWKLVARDAFNGKLLWKREIPEWMTHLYNFRGGPKQLPRRLVSIADHVYVTLGLGAPVVKLDAATGKTLMTYRGSARTEEILYHNGALLTVIGDPDILIEKSDDNHGYWEMAEYEAPTIDKTIVAYDADSGKKLWTVKGKNLRHIAPLSLCALGDKVFYLDNKLLRCVNATSGKEHWTAPFETKGLFIRAYAPTVVAYRDAIMCLKWNRFTAFSVDSGKTLWDHKRGAMGFGSPGDVLAIGDKAWVIPMMKSIWGESARNKDGVITTGINIPKTNFFNNAKSGVGIDIRTGEIADDLPFAHTQHHHRCYRNKSTQEYILLGHSGIQVIDLATKQNETHRWVRGLCQYGIMPANGYIYVPPDTCQCYNSGKINGFFALSEKNSFEDITLEPVLEKGPAYGIELPAAELSPKAAWPTHRADNARSGRAPCELPAKPVEKWRATIGATVTAPVIAGGRIFVADRDAYTVHCRDAKTGKAVWKYLANGPIDSPPTIHMGLCVFGCGDGSVYCLDARNGKLAWRFKTSKVERRIGYEDRLESPLRIHGSVLVQDGTVYFAAGYSSNLDGGIRVYGLDLHTGEQRHAGSLASGPWGKEGKWGYLADIPVSDGKIVGFRNAKFDATLKQQVRGPVLIASTGMLEDSWFHRQGWVAPAGGKGQLIVRDGEKSISVVSPYTGLKRRRKGKWKEFNQVGHLHQKFTRYKEEFFPVGTTIAAKGKGKGAGWTKDIDLQPRAMVLAGDKLSLAGWIDDVVIEVKSGRAKSHSRPDPHDSVLRIYSTDKGEVISETTLDSEPTFDGMAVAEGKLFMSLKNGELVCYGK